MQSILARRGFLIAGVVFFLGTLLPLVTGGTLNVTFFVLAIVFLVLGAAVARNKASNRPSNR